MKLIEGGICAAKGFTANGIHCGIRKNRSKRDLSLIYSQQKASAAAVYTTNLVKGAPLIVTKEHLQNGTAQAVICNSGNAKSLQGQGVISGGMIPKVDCCIDAIGAGVKNVVMMDGRVPHSILMELLTDEGAGTMVTQG